MLPVCSNSLLHLTCSAQCFLLTEHDLLCYNAEVEERCVTASRYQQLSKQSDGMRHVPSPEHGMLMILLSHLSIIRCRECIRAIKVEQVSDTPKHALLHTGAPSEAKVMQPAAKQGAAYPTLHAPLKSCLYPIFCPSAQSSNCSRVPASSVHVT